jgi:hypothetical protein
MEPEGQTRIINKDAQYINLSYEENYVIFTNDRLLERIKSPFQI